MSQRLDIMCPDITIGITEAHKKACDSLNCILAIDSY
jgi:hypothetical protein